MSELDQARTDQLQKHIKHRLLVIEQSIESIREAMEELETLETPVS